jgi:hypothetical protein
MSVVADLISVALDSNWWHKRRPCLFCGGCSDKEPVSARVYSNVIDQPPTDTAERVVDDGWAPLDTNMIPRHADTGLLQTHYIVCSDCLVRQRADLQQVIRSSAAWHRERATELETIADNLPTLPSLQEWEKANDESWG